MAETTMQSSKTPIPWWLVLLQGIAALILGILLLTAPLATTLVLVQFIGIYWLIGGIFEIVSIFTNKGMWGWKLISGLLGIVAGIVILQHPLWSGVLVPATLVVFMGIQGILMGAIHLVEAFRGGGLGIGVLGVLNLLVGIFLINNPLAGAVALPFILGMFAVISGILAIILAFKIK